jgi:iron complex outermembrane recepter protein
MFRTWWKASSVVALAASVCAAGGLAMRAEAEDRDSAFAARAAEWVADADGSTPQDAADESSPEPAKPEAAKPKGIEEITVTGRRREELLQSTPLSMIAISDEELESRQFSSITDVGEAAANVKFDTTNGSNSETRVFIRGVGQDDSRSNVDPGVGIYVDGVYYPRAQGSAIGINDVERIEVLRGPQGTLFGKNTVGGVVHVITKKPQPEFEGQASVRYGKFDLFETNTSFNIPVVPEKVFTRFSFTTQTDDGYLRNDFDGKKAGDNKLLAGRFALRSLLSDSLTFDFTAERSREDEKSPVNECRIGSPLSQGRFFQDNLTDFVSQCTSTRSDGEELRGSQSDVRKQDQDIRGLTGTFTWEVGNGTLTSISSWREVAQRFTGTDLDGSGARSFGLGRGKFENDTWSQEFQYTNKAFDDKLTYQVGVYAFQEDGHGKIVLDSLTNALGSADAPLNVAFAPNAAQKRIELNDVRNLLNAVGLNQSALAPIMNTSGLTFGALDETVSRLAALRPFLTGGQSATPEAVQAALLSNSPTRLRDNVFLLNGEVLDEFENDSYAAFGEFTYDFTDRLALTAGARYTEERRFRQGKQLRFDSPENRNPSTLGLPISDRFDKWTSRAQLSFQATDDIFLYSSYSRGFKSGGFNATVVSNDPIGIARRDRGKFDQETVDAYEVGIKTSWLDNRLLLNLTGYYYQYDDIQITTIQINEQGTPVGQISNVAEAVIQGLELDFQTRPFGNLFLSGGLGLIDADYRDFTARIDTQQAFRVTGADALFGQCQTLALDDPDPNCSILGQVAALGFFTAPGDIPMADMSDLDRTNTPSFSMNLSADYTFDLGDWGSLAMRTTWYQQGKVFFSTNNDDDVSQNKYGLLNGRIAWTLWDSKTTLALFGRNLLDRRYLDGGFSVEDTIGSKPVFYGRPRSYGIEILRRF